MHYLAALTVREEAGLERRAWPLTRGVPLPPGAVTDPGGLRLQDAQGRGVPLQTRALSRWPDGSVKWVLADFQADLPAGGEAVYLLCSGAGEEPAAPEHCVQIHEEDERLVVCTGPLRFAVGKRRYGLLQEVELGRLEGSGFVREVSAAPEPGESWARICEASPVEGTRRRIYGMGGICRASLAQDAYRVEVEEAGQLRSVIRCEGALEAEAPMHHYAGYRPFRLVTRIHAFAGHAFVRVLHTVVVACDPGQTELEELAVRIPLGSADTGKIDRVTSGTTGPDSRRFQVGGNRAPGKGDRGDRPMEGMLSMEGVLAPEEGLLLAQHQDRRFRLERPRRGGTEILDEGEQAAGWAVLEGEEAGLGVALRHIAEEYPKALGLDPGGIDLFLWKDPDGGRLDFRRYAGEVAWHEGEGVYSDGLGTAKTSEFFLDYFRGEESGQAPRRLAALLDWPQAAVDPGWMARCQVAGGFAPRDPAAFPRSERMLDGFLEWMARSIEANRWYGFLDWGDVLVAWEESTGAWRFRGRWGWCNSEWDPRHAVWIQYARSGEARWFRLGEAMTRHSMDVDTCHYHPLRPYMVGGCFRHSLDHFGDEPCASHTFIDNWIDFYYLTGDHRTLEVLREAGEFFLHYRWSEDPRFSFSLRSIANTLRGLLYLWELTGEERYRQRADEVFAVVARGQNEDGSWHKRFQVSTPDRLPEQLPCGMATEGTTLAVEMGTAEPFTGEELAGLWGPSARGRKVLPLSELKGYQTHYLMIGLELMHRLTGRADVAECYLRAVDWFCGGPRAFDAEFAWKQQYGGILCRHLGYACRLTGERGYLEVGRQLLVRLAGSQDWSDDPRKRGALGLSPMYLGLLFFGVPCLLGVLREAGLEE